MITLLLITINIIYIAISNPVAANRMGWVTAVGLIITIIINFPSSHQGGLSLILGGILLTIMVFPIVIILAITSYSKLFTNKQPAEATKSYYISIILTGCIIPAVLLLSTLYSLNAFHPWVVYSSAILLGFVTAVAALKLLNKPARVLMGSLSISIFVILLISIISANFVAKEASLQAKGRPYCLFVAYNADYRPMNSLIDLSPIIMRADRNNNLFMQHHAILAVKNENYSFYHWSYRQEKFISGTFPRSKARHLPSLEC